MRDIEKNDQNDSYLCLYRFYEFGEKTLQITD